MGESALIDARIYRALVEVVNDIFFEFMVLLSCQEKMLNSHQASFAEKLHWRGRAINLALQCAQGAVIASGGAANIIDHPAGRVYREALGQRSHLFELKGFQVYCDMLRDSGNAIATIKVSVTSVLDCFVPIPSS